jgi:hypothetical protein
MLAIWVAPRGKDQWMTKSQIIERVLMKFRNVSEETGIPESVDSEYEKVIVAALEKSLWGVGQDTEIRTCEDFGYLGVQCCECCHDIHQHYEISLIDIEGGGKAWVCCAIDRALKPAKHANLPQIPENATFGEVLGQFVKRCESAN